MHLRNPAEPCLPSHGPLACRKCYGSNDASLPLELGPWRAVNDPGAWGSSNPRVLVLGFSKGFTQAGAYTSGNFDAVPFAEMRPRLTEVLHRLDLLRDGESVDSRMTSTEREMAFGSLVRCSLSRYDTKLRKHVCTGSIMPKAFTEMASGMVRRCAETYLTNFPSSLRLVVMLGITGTYISRCKTLINSLYPGRYAEIDHVSYRTGGVIWTHASHPSRLNGHHSAWLHDEPSTKTGKKRVAALAAVALSGWSR